MVQAHLTSMLSQARSVSATSRRSRQPEPPARSAISPALTFAGGAGTLTGSRFLVETAAARVLVNCGLFQGPLSFLKRNWSPVPDELHGVDAVVLTDARLERCGYLPALVAQGWRGPIYVTPGTAALVTVSLADSAALFEEDAALDDLIGWSGRRHALPPFREADAARVNGLLRVVEFGARTEIADGIHLEFGRAGRLLGSAWARLDLGDRQVVFSGELGRPGHPLLRPPQPRPACDVLVLDAAHAIRSHVSEHETDLFAAAIHRAVKRGGDVLIPASAVDRAEAILMTLRGLADTGAIPDLPVRIDAPTGLTATRVHELAAGEGWPELTGAGLRLPYDLSEVDDGEELRGPSVIIAGNGMATGGRVLDHLERMLPDPRHGVVILGPAEPETLVRRLRDGARQVKIRGRYRPVRAEITHFDGLGTHGGAEVIRAWATGGPEPEAVFLVDGEPDQAEALAKWLRVEAGWCAAAVTDGERVLL